MKININSFGDELQTMDMYLGVDDYVALFKKEVGFGTLLRVYEELGKIISSDEDRLHEWLGGDWYKSVIDTTNKVASIINNTNIHNEEIPIIYPLTIVNDRYGGTYSGGEYTAWRCYPWSVPDEILGDDGECADFFRGANGKYNIIYGRGNTPGEAVSDLAKRLRGDVDNE